MDPLARSLKASPEMWLHGLDLVQDRVSFIGLTRKALAQASFLDDRMLPADAALQWAPWSSVEAAVAEAGLAERCRFILHIGHVGSTLLSRLLDADPRVLGLREPLALRALAQVHAELVTPESLWSPDAFDRRLGAALALWSRVFEDGQASVIKATSVCCEMATALLGRPGRPQAVFMFTPPGVHLATLFGGPNNRLDVMAMAQGRLRRLHRRLGGPAWRLSELSYAEIAAMSWACEMTALGVAVGPQALWLDFERFLQRPQSQLKAVFAHLGLEADDARIAAIIAGPVMSRYSKAPEHAYDAALRAQVLTQALRQHGAEIREGLAWLDRAAGRFPLVAAALDRAAGP